MNNAKIELKQREHLVSLVQEAKQREKEDLEDNSGVTKDSIYAEVIDSKGLSPMLKQVGSLSEQIGKFKKSIAEIDAKFESYGFERSGDALSFINWKAPEAITKLISAKWDASRRPIEKSLKKYDLAISKVWTATTSEELQKAVEGLF